MADTFNVRIKHKRDTSANWTSKNPVLLNGEIVIVDTDAGGVRYKVGDGVKTYTQLPFDDEALRSLVNSKADAVDVPTKTSDLTNDSGFITTADIPEGAAASTTSPKMDGTAAVGTELAFARGDHAHPSDTSRVPVTRTINGKALSSNITLSASDVNADAYGAASSALSSAKSYTDTQVNELKNGNVTVNHATNADEANHAASADIAGEADHAVLADNATNANHATSADSATKATQDGNGKVIATTYETKADAASKLTEAKGYTDQMVGELGEGFEGVIRQMYADDITEGGAPTIREIAADEAGYALADAKSYADSKVAAIDYPVDSVNGKTGAVSLTYSDVGAAASSHGTHVTYSTTAPVMDGTASVGSAATVARSDHKHPTDTSRVPTSRTVNGKALSANITLSASDVGADASGAAATALTDAKSYTDTKISALINSAPTTLDTLGEIAAAMEDNADVVGALETAVGNKANAADLTSHVNNKSNPHGVSLSQLGVTATASELNYMDGVTSNVQTQLNGKASSSHSHDEYVTDNFSALAVRDKGNNRVIVTASQKDDIVSIVCDDGINVVGTASKEENGDYVMGQILIEGVPAGTGYGVVKSGGDVTITNGVITVNDDSHNHTIANVDGLQTALDGKAASSHGTHVSYSTTAPVMDGTAAVGTASTVARSDHKHPSDTSRVPTTRKVNGKALSADITLSASDVGAAASSHTHDYAATSHAHGNITNAGAIGTAANKAVITTTNGVLTTGTVPVASGGTGATTAAAALTNLGLTATAAELNIMDGVTATAAEINKLDGLAAKTAELNYVIGVTSNIQTQLNTKATTGYVNDQIDGVLVALESHATGHAPSNAEKNQNAFSNVTVGATTIAADTTTDTLTLVAGDNVELTPDATNDKITINALNSGFDIIYAGATTLNSAGGVSDLTIDGGNGVSVSGNASDNSITISGVAATTTTPGVMSAYDKTKLDYTNVAYGTCATGAATAAKFVNLSGNSKWALTSGSIVHVFFSETNTASNPTLNVNSTGAKNIYYGASQITTSSLGYAGTANRLMTFVYDGTQYRFAGWGYDSNTTYTNVKLGHGYATCSTAAATTAKVGTLSSYTLTTGGIVAVKFTYAVPASATLNINSKGAKAIYHRGAAIKAGVIEAGDLATFMYNGSQYHLLSVDRDKDTAYTHPTYTAKSSGLYKVTVDGTGHVSAATAVAKADITALGIPAQDTTYSAASTSAAGLMSAADKTKLDGIATGATKITVDTALSSTSTNPVQNKVINTALAGKSDTSHSHSNYVPTSRTVNGKALSGNISLTASDVGATAVTLNGASSGAAASFYAPTAAGTKGYILSSNGSGAPIWANPDTQHIHQGTSLNPSAVEINPGSGATHGGYIDFHFGGDTGDYTTRIIESQSNQLKVEGTLQVADTSNTSSGARVRNIMVSTTDLTAGTSKLATGRIWFCYE